MTVSYAEHTGIYGRSEVRIDGRCRRFPGPCGPCPVEAPAIGAAGAPASPALRALPEVHSAETTRNEPPPDLAVKVSLKLGQSVAGAPVMSTGVTHSL